MGTIVDVSVCGSWGKRKGRSLGFYLFGRIGLVELLEVFRYAIPNGRKLELWLLVVPRTDP